MAEPQLPAWASDEPQPQLPAWARDDSETSIDPATGRLRITVRPEGERVSTPEALARGAGSGATFGFLPRIAGGLAAAGAAEAAGLAGVDIDPYAVGEQVTREQRARQKAAREQHPYAYGGAEFVGGAAVPLPGGALMGAGRGVGTRMLGGALQGALGGGLAGAGEAETVGQMPGAAGRGALMGGIVGAPLGAVAPAVTHFVTAPVRSFMRPQAQAERVLGEAAAQVQRTPAFDAGGQPVRFIRGSPDVPPEAIVADYLGVPGQNLARWAKNTSPVAAAELQSTLADRARGVRARQMQFLNRSGVGENELEIQRLRAEAARENSPLYQLAMWHGNQLPYSPQLEALRQAPAIQTAIAGAQTSLQNRAVGLGARSGAPAAPLTGELAYWDQVKRGLDSQIGRAERAGDREQMSELIPLKQGLVDTLDTLVPEYANARGNARMYFGRENAIEAGAHAVNNPELSYNTLRRSWNEMSSQDRQLLQMAGRNEFARQTESGQVDWNRILDPRRGNNERQKLELFFGNQGFRELEATHHAETIMNWMQRAVQGNSTTTQQYLTALALGSTGAMGGAGAGGYTYGDVSGAIGGGLPGILMLLSRSARIRGNTQVAEQLGQMLTSRDPQMLERVLAAARRSDSFMQTLRDLGKAAMARGPGAELGQREQRQQQGEL